MTTTFLLATLILAPAAAPIAPPPAPATAVAAYSYDTELVVRPIRQRRNTMIGAELGLNGLSGAGLMVSRDFGPHFALDGAAGMGLTGLRGGLRARVNLLKSRLTPFVIFGGSMSTGLSRVELRDKNQDTVTATIDPTPTVQGGAGLSYVSEGGFALLASLGYAQVLRDNTYRITQGRAKSDTIRVLDLIAGSGPMATVTLGYAF